MFKTIRIATSRSAVRVVGVFEGTARVPRGLTSINDSLKGAIATALSTPGFRGDAGETLAAGENAVVVGLGRESEFTADIARTVGARLLRALDRMQHAAIRLDLDQTVPEKVLKGEVLAATVVDGMALANWCVDFFDGSATQRTPAKGTLTIAPTSAGQRKAVERALTIAESTNFARRLAATPPNVCNPAWIAAEARKMGRGLNLRVSVITGAQAKELGMGGLVNVGKGSTIPPRMIVIEHKPAKAKKNVRLVLVGKTITYDTGGYSLKISNGMKGMKYDKCGGTAVLGAIRAIAALEIPVHTYAVLPAAENMVNGEAYRPDDIITMYNGVTVEVTNTDAEGRLVLADALAYSCAKLKPTAIVDAATLTGGVVVGLGHFCSGMWCEDDGLRAKIEQAAVTAGEKVWRLPLWPEHRDFMRAKHADIWNSGPSRNAHPIQGAAFLSYFVDEEIPWCHLDIAGVSDVESDKDLAVMGPTGYGVRLMTELAQSFA